VKNRSERRRTPIRPPARAKPLAETSAGEVSGVERMLVHDWNSTGALSGPPAGTVELDDETLRDGLQSPSALCPPLEKKIELLHHMEALGIDAADIGYPGAGSRALADVIALAEEIGRTGLRIQANCAGRTVPTDIRPIAEAQQRSGTEIEAALFLGSSPIRQHTEGWNMDFLRRTTEEAVTLAKSLGLEVMFVTEDTTRAHPDHLRALYATAIEAGARRICIADTVGHVAPWGVQELVRFVHGVVAETREPVRIDWHGHRDRGLDLINSLVAVTEGVDRVHACGLGIGERVGNLPMDLLLVNLKLLGWIDRDLRALPAYCRAVAEATGMSIPPNYPVVGKDAFETSTGVHAAAILKALRRGDEWLADRVYSSVPAREFGLEQVISIGPMSGQANVVAWLDRRGLHADPETVEHILSTAKASDRILRDEEVLQLLPSLHGVHAGA
jgi:isopropylmalate/homocitrate/citramalate synthase